MLALGWTLFVAALAGFSRGFAAFGTAMIFVPLVTLAYDAKTAVVTLFLVDLVPALVLMKRAAPECDMRAMLWMAVGALALTPVGVAVLVIADPDAAQFAIGIVLLVATALTTLAPRLGRAVGGGSAVARPVEAVAGGRWLGVVAGAASGFAGGLCGMFGPPAVVYLLARRRDARTTRADIIMFLSVEGLLLGAIYLVYGLYTWPLVRLALLLLPIYALMTWLGARLFSKTGEAAYRRIMLGLLWAVALLLVVKGLVRV